MLLAKRRAPRPGPGLEVYWRFAAERQAVYYRYLAGEPRDQLTADPVIRDHRFTNAYRASDRVSQYLITDVIYDKERLWLDTFARILVFKLFNRVSTWQHIEHAVGEVTADELLDERIDMALEAVASLGPIYNAAYIMPPPRSLRGPKYRRHLELVRRMIADGVHEKIARARSLEDAYVSLRHYESIGPFLAYQFAIDLNYSPHLAFSENDFVVAGPGALRGLKKCFADPGDYSSADLIRWVAEQQESAFGDRGLAWSGLWGRPLQLIDAQNLFCEVDKYTRAAHPELSIYAKGDRIKQKYQPTRDLLTAWFPPKWELNDTISSVLASRPPTTCQSDSVSVSGT